jgi:non-ribosomal peptide synthetase component F
MANPADVCGATAEDESLAAGTRAGVDAGEARPWASPESGPGGSRDVARRRLVHDGVAEQAARTPGATAVSADGRVLSCAELDAAANRLARFLRARGVGPETRVGVCLERSAELVVALLATLRGRGLRSPGFAYPAERLAWSLADSGAPVLVTRAASPAASVGGE